MILQHAYEAAQSLLDVQIRPVHGEEVVICSCEDFANAWVFGYNTRKFLLEMDLEAALVGNGPVIVPKSGDRPFLGLSGSPVEEQVANL